MTAELTRPVDAVPAAGPEPAEPPQERTRVDRLLDSLDDLVRRHRALATHDGASADLHAELIAAELDQQIAVLRTVPRQHHR
ncbi:hypothetical protein Ae168Ps1_1553 [Pseudonocardia sp. Ae168_Ps1]|uniref:hypothetical protein n=1 Tax=unclassified Pseudonocardia TaxID=2619320 RepID=UPI0001FFF04D|nr:MULTISPECIES: hypothetical protein [unclassified Pseudonocardia]ALE72776.1 hypothetical protein FRP1_06060 [Pseudonocardia sp. EC080625-04]ALL76095.1 hypothetical protein AD006_13680 [Pseudonocardia sp. EC080610-09]ALL83119.1 hypothetical protein AD017_21505 [Pseudonocardia sp. EC080619-01]OLL73170.1 hypothetical protein Ae150APs1_1548 [Pseudonocardia sp. Ae150A_Ps1]OLL79147.1 hypothetical protein Ae168Ps1_1553 [Pseudonocardia sp. Ae168_Ps1]